MVSFSVSGLVSVSFTDLDAPRSDLDSDSDMDTDSLRLTFTFSSRSPGQGRGATGEGAAVVRRLAGFHASSILLQSVVPSRPTEHLSQGRARCAVLGLTLMRTTNLFSRLVLRYGQPLVGSEGGGRGYGESPPFRPSSKLFLSAGGGVRGDGRWGTPTLSPRRSLLRCSVLGSHTSGACRQSL
ncbi:hypothetical protein BD310DRAFT_920976 [Dichomitus squalens]|uniref:Uncharacterized protein n=1 Tax=Dichomitus squalens TaxID=114155 RepID=A0A4Q9Q2F3_9APHY|nr:hypothetical protein BD310DRAFT_920976 [Dichomitus squalens]